MIAPRELPVFRKTLLGWFREQQRDLPWRRTRDPYRIWLAEIMLQQTRVAAVIPYYQRFLERFPDVGTLAEAAEEQVLQWWSGLGYYRRARHLQQAARAIVAKHGGRFPQAEEDVLALPGIGRYTAAAILSTAFGAKQAVLDGNVARVLARLGAMPGDLRERGRWRTLQNLAGELLDAKSAGDWNQGLMELGAVVCKPRAPECVRCPVAKYCRARQLGLTASIPQRRKKRAAVKVTLATAIFLDPRGRTLLLPPPGGKARQEPKGEVAALFSEMWHFPTLAVRRNPAAELRKVVAALLGAAAPANLPVARLPAVRHVVTFRNITLLPYRIRVPKLPRNLAAKIVSLSELCAGTAVAISSLTRKAARAAADRARPEGYPYAQDAAVREACGC